MFFTKQIFKQKVNLQKNLIFFLTHFVHILEEILKKVTQIREDLKRALDTDTNHQAIINVFKKKTISSSMKN